MKKIIVVIALLFLACSVSAAEGRKEYPTSKGPLYVGMTQLELYNIFPENYRISVPHNVRGERWIIFKNWTSNNANDVITVYLKDGAVTGWRENYNPFPANKGSKYEFKQGEKIDIWFFPADKAKWNGEQLNALEWNILVDSQKVMFLTEYIKQVNEQNKANLDIDIQKYILAMNHYSDTCPEECSMVPMTTVVNDLLIQEGKASPKQ